VLGFLGARVFDGDGLTEPQDVYIADGVIADGPIVGAETIDARGKTLLPGVIDAHVHLGFFGGAKVLRGGVTTVRDLGWPLDKVRALAARQDGPTVLYAGPMLTAPRGYPTRAGWAPRGTGLEVADVQEAADAVARLVQAGASVIKIAQTHERRTLDQAVIGAIVAAAHGLGLRVTSHCSSLEQLEVALTAGVDELAHGLWSDEAIPAEMIGRMVAAHMTVIPTLHIDPSPARVVNTAAFVEAGGRVIYGTDMGNHPVPPGIDVVELDLMERAGMSPASAIAAATRDAAAYLSLEDRGRIAPGMRADLILVEDDPLQHPAVLGHPSTVLRGGVLA
jgi:imidazolonepropionase-like amidohydrolase